MKRWLLAVALCGATLLPSLVQAQLPPLFTPSGNPITTGVITSQAASGQTPIVPLAGHSNCTVVASDTVAGTSITVNGTAMTPPSSGSQWFPNPNFGTSGVISVGTSAASTTGNVANFPGGLYLSWSGNTGILNVYATCSTAVAKRTATPGPTPTPIVLPTPGGTVFATTGNQSVTTPAVANQYVQLGATTSVTTTTSNAPQGQWLLTVTMQGSVAGNTAQPMFGCVTSTTAGFTVLDQMTVGSQLCTATPPVTGTAILGLSQFATAVASDNRNGSSQVATAHLTVPNNFTFSMGCYVASPSGSAFTYFGYCCVQGIPI